MGQPSFCQSLYTELAGKGSTEDRPAFDANIGEALGLSKTLLQVKYAGNIGKSAMIHNDATPSIEVVPETYEVRADGVLLTCEPASTLPMAQRYFLF